MSGQEKLFIVSIIVAAFVILGLTIIFAFLFFLYAVYKRKNIKYGFEDTSLINEVKENTYKKNLKIRKHNRGCFLTLKEALKEEEKQAKALNILMNIFCSIIIVFLFGVFSVGLTYRVNNDNLFINDTTYLTILTGSMETKNEKNDYLEKYDLNNQITQYSLVGITKVEDLNEIKLWDIIAYEHEGNIILHRVIDIYTDDEDPSIICFKLRGDANSASLSYEEKICKNDIVGKYNGFQNYGLGVFLTYIKSEIGFIALLGAAVFLFLATFAEDMVNKAYKIRIDYLIDESNPLCQFKYQFLYQDDSYLSSLNEEVYEYSFSSYLLDEEKDNSLTSISLNEVDKEIKNIEKEGEDYEK